MTPQSDARAVLREMLKDRAEAFRELDLAMRAYKGLTKNKELPPDLMAAFKAVVKLEYELGRLTYMAGLTKSYTCSECDAEVMDPTAQCPECGTQMEGPPAPTGPGTTARLEDDPEIAAEMRTRKSGGRLDGKPLYEKTRAQKSRRAVIL